MTRLAAGLWLLLQGPALVELTGRVVDSAGVLTAEQESVLSQRLETLERDSSVQLVIVTIETLEGDPIEDYTHRLAQSWGIGQAEADNGLVLLVAVRDRRVRIEVGYGLEGAIPDGLAGRIIRERITPAFREGDYFAGLSDAVTGLELAARQEYPDAPPEAPGARREVGTWLIFSIFILGMLGSIFGVVVAVIVGAVLVPVLSGLGWWGVPLGALAGLLASWFFRSRGGGGWTYPTSGGGFAGGGGGFSGGGGSFGGGGASGSW